MSNGNSSSKNGSKSNANPPVTSVKKKRRKFKRSHIIAIIILVAVIGGYYYYKKNQASKNQVQYVTQAAEKGTLTSSISASGNVVVDQSASIDPTITGTVTNVAVQVGDSVKKGQLLFTIVNGDLTVSVAKSTASLVQAQSSLESAKASKKQTSADYSNAFRSGSGKSAKDKVALKDKKEAADAAVTSAEQNIVAAQADLTNQRLNAGKRNVVSTISGTVNAVNIKNGDDLSKLSSGSSRTVPIIIGDLGTQKAQVQVNEVDVANVSIGQQAVLTFDALPGFSETGKVEKMDSLGTLSQGVVTYNVTIGLDSLDTRIKPGMSVSASIITAVKQDVLIVPNSALKNQGNNYYVEVLNGTTPLQQDVQIGAVSSTETEITSGLNAGDKVVTQTISSGATTSTTSTSAANRTGGGGAGGLRIPGLGGGGRPD